MMMTTRWLGLVCALFTTLWLGGCPDEEDSSRGDTVTGDTASDTASTDSVAGDTTVAVDTTAPTDTTPPADTTPPTDTTPPADTVADTVADTAGDTVADTTTPPVADDHNLTAHLDGLQEVPSNGTAAYGTARVVLHGSGDAITVTIDTTDLTGVTGAHIHLGDVGLNGGVLFPLSAGDWSSPFEVTLTDANLTATGGITTFAAAADAIAAGETYINIHTDTFPGGELRGQIGPVSLSATLGGGQEVPRVATAGFGSATVALDDAQQVLTVTVTVADLNGTSAAHLHMAPTGLNGAVLLPLASASFESFEIALTDDNVTLDQPWRTTLAELLGGRTYINVHTEGTPSGELRGQVGAARLAASLGGGQEVPAVDTAGTGTATVRLNGAQDAMVVGLNIQDVNETSAAHLHGPALPGANGGVLYTLFSGGVPAAAEVTVDLSAPGSGTQADAVDALLSGQTYINVHTSAHSGGEVRGQVGTTYLAGTMEHTGGSSESGTVAVKINGAQDSVEVTVSHNLPAVLTSSIRLGAADDFDGPALFTLAGITLNNPLVAELDDSDLLPVSGEVETFAHAVNALISGATYADVSAAISALAGQIEAP